MVTKRQIDVDRLFQALGDPTRRAMLEKLTAGAMSVSQLAASFAISLAAVVQHLQVLEESALVATEKTGRVRTCRVDARGLAAATKWLADRRPEWEKRLDRLGDLLGEDGKES